MKQELSLMIIMKKVVWLCVLCSSGDRNWLFGHVRISPDVKAAHIIMLL